MEKHVREMIRHIKEQLEVVKNENNRQYLYGKLDAYKDILLLFIEK
jgi:hypothetical protein